MQYVPLKFPLINFQLRFDVVNENVIKNNFAKRKISETFEIESEIVRKRVAEQRPPIK